MHEAQQPGEIGDSGEMELLHQLGWDLKRQGYRFITVTPETHRRVLERRPLHLGINARQVWGWNMPFDETFLPSKLKEAFLRAAIISKDGPHYRSKVRFSTIDEELFVHSGYPTIESDSVFFGPDTYRFVGLIRDEIQLRHARPRRVVDIGCGGGAGGLMAAKFIADIGEPTAQVELVDINARALAMSRVNAGFSGIEHVDLREADLYAQTAGGVDMIVANPPYLVDKEERLYRHGGGLGFDLSLRIVEEGVPKLAPGGRLVLYTGVPIVAGKDVFMEAVAPWLDADGLDARYWELDPDVFGEEVAQPWYDRVDRIAAVALVIRKEGGMT